MKYLQGKRAPFVVPAAVVLAIGAGAAAPVASGAPAPPSLPKTTPEQVVAQVLSAQPPELTGQLNWTADLGLGDLTSAAGELGAGGAGGAFNPLSLLNGSYQVDAWLDGAKAEHLAMSPQPGQELDFVRNGNQAWTWDSSTLKVQHFTWPARRGSGGTVPSSTTVPTSVPETPQQLAQRILTAVGKSSTVDVPTTRWVAGIATYELVLTPGAAGSIASVPNSTVDHIAIDVAGRGPLAGIPLQVAVYAKGQALPALQLGFGPGLQTGAPPPSELTFTPPTGATVVNHTLGAHQRSRQDGTAGQAKIRSKWSGSSASAPTTIGSGWDAVCTGTTSALGNPRYRQALEATTTLVTVGGQQARLFSSALANVLFVPGGRYYAGLVTPGFLEATAAKAAGA
ncbi:MAG TPA: hypothetical protein VFN61_16255 [Acidimicrobiales bacterium]|nr:hypothetical protein [Acidimicrobiales bacterium]